MDRNTFEKFSKYLEQSSEEESRKLEPYINILVEQLNLSQELANDIVLYAFAFSPRISKTEFLHSTNSFISLFGSANSLCEILKAHWLIDTSINVSFRKRTIYCYPQNIIADRFYNLMNTLSITKEECVNDIITNPGWIYYTESYINDRFQSLMNFWGLDIVKVRNFCNKYNFFFGTRLKNFEQKLQNLSEYFDMPVFSIKELMLTYPSLIIKPFSFFKSNKITKEIFDKPWILECLNEYPNCSFGGYRTFENLIYVIEHIEKTFGKIIRFINKTYNNNKFTGVITRNEDSFYIVSIGADYITEHAKRHAPVLSEEEKLLQEIFGTHLKCKDCEEMHKHKELFLRLKNDCPQEINLIATLLIALSHKGITYKAKIKNDENMFSSLLTSNFIISDYLNLSEKLDVEENNLNVEFFQLHIDNNGVITLLGSKEDVDFYSD